MAKYAIECGDCREVLRGLPDNSIDAVVTDPPYELGFMGKGWDKSGIANDVGLWQEVLRVLKPGGHLLAFSGSRTYHRMTCAIEDAGFEIRDMMQWLYGTGFPKSMDVSKAIDKAAGVEREVVALRPARLPQGQARGWGNTGVDTFRDAHRGTQPMVVTVPATEAAEQWQGWGTALKPAQEPIVVARKPLSEKNVAANVLKWGTGALNIDACRIGWGDGGDKSAKRKAAGYSDVAKRALGGVVHSETKGFASEVEGSDSTQGRWPANVVHDGSAEVLECFPQDVSKSSGGKGGRSGLVDNEGIYGAFSGDNPGDSAGGFGDTGTVARFFYCAKPSKSERNAGLTGKGLPRMGLAEGENKWTDVDYREGQVRENGTHQNFHPTVKPVALMRYLIRLVTPPNGVVLDPFMGSGTTGMAAVEADFRFVGIEQDGQYIEIAERRIAYANRAFGIGDVA